MEAESFHFCGVHLYSVDRELLIIVCKVYNHLLESFNSRGKAIVILLSNA